MSSDPSSARDVWARLRHSGHDSSEYEIPTRPTDVETGFGPVRLGLGPQGEARLLLPLSPTEHAGEIHDGNSLKIRTAQYRKDNKPQRFLDIICQDSVLEAVFNEVVDEILTRVRNGGSCVEACATTLTDFRELLNPAPTTEIDARKIRGLVGELIYLDRLLALDGSAWQLWRGPLKEGERHDFRGSDRSIEIKTTTRTSSSKIHISSIDQLSPPSGGSLHLVKFVLEQAASAPLTVRSLTASILSRSAYPKEIERRLAAMGCNDYNSTEWNRLAFQLEGEDVYEVKTGFPRIVAESFPGATPPAGVSGVEYVVDLSVAKSFLVDAAAAQLEAGRLIACL